MLKLSKLSDIFLKKDMLGNVPVAACVSYDVESVILAKVCCWFNVGRQSEAVERYEEHRPDKESGPGRNAKRVSHIGLQCSCI